MARLPEPGGDHDQWGNILNTFLSVAHEDDGSLKNTGVVAAKYTRPSGGIPKSDLSTDVQETLDLAESGGAPDATPTTKGILRLSGSLTGDALVPLIAAGAVTGGGGGSIASGTITNANIHASAAIDKSKLAPLAITNSDIATGAAITQNKIADLQTDLAAKAPLIHAHTISDVTNLQTALDGKAASIHQHAIGDITSLQTVLDGKAATTHAHTASSITDLEDALAGVIGNKVQAGDNVTVDYDDETGVTTVSATTTGSGEPSDMVLSVAGRTGDVVLGAGDITTGTFTTDRIPSLDASKINAGTFGIGRIPTGTNGTTVALGDHTHANYASTTHTHNAADITSGTFDITRLPTGTTSTSVAVGNHSHADYSPAAHNHDTRYYTETEMDAFLSDKLDTSEKGLANGVATLGADSKIPASQLPAIAIKDTFTVANQSAMLALTAQRGDMAIRTDSGQTFVLASDSPSTLGDWKELTTGYTSPVTSVAGRTGDITLTKTDVGLSNVNDTSDLGKPISTATQNALDEKATIIIDPVDESSYPDGTIFLYTE